MDARLIQQQVLIGGKVDFILKTGQTVSGTLCELSLSYVVIETNGRKTTIFIEMIGGWQTDGSQTEPPPAHPPIPPEIVPPPIETARNENDAPPVDPALTKTLLLIEAKYDAHIRVARIELDKFELNFPTEEVPKEQLRDIRAAWQTIRNIYDNAVKVHELDPRYGRIDRVANELIRLSDNYPNIHGFKRQAAHFCFLSGDQKKTLGIWKEIAIATNEPEDWRNLAAIAMMTQDKDVCCYALERYYSKAKFDESQSTWFVFVGSVRVSSNYSALFSVVKDHAILSTEELQTVFEAGIYLLNADGNEPLAIDYLYQFKDTPPSPGQITDLLKQFSQDLNASYAKVQTDLEKMMHLDKVRRAESKRPEAERSEQSRRLCHGAITLYKEDQAYGFILGDDEVKYFFHRNSIADPELLQQINKDSTIRSEVHFMSANGSRGPIAFEIELFRSIEDMAKIALSYADATEYQKAAAEMRHLLRIQPDYPNGQEIFAKWSQFAAEKKIREATLPKGSGYYARAKCVEIVERDPERAVDLYRMAIKHNDRQESAVKDLATVLGQLGRNQEAIDILLQHRDQSKDTRSIDGILMMLYQKMGNIEKAVPLLLKRAQMASKKEKRFQIIWVIANLYLSQQEFATAEGYFRQVLDGQPSNTIAKRHIAICMLKQNRLDESERILNEILEYTSDAQAVEVLAAVQQARDGGLSSEIDILISTSLSDFFTEISPLTKFFLDHCDFKGVPPDRVQAQRFNRKDVEMLEERVAKISSRLPRDRSSFYLSAAKIDSMLEDSDPNRFYRYLGRSFASMGDAIVLESGLLDSACDLYCEALSVYDNDHAHNRDERDAANALTRVIYSTLGMSRIIMTTGSHLSIDEAIESVIDQHPNRTRVFYYIAYLIYRSRYAAARVLNRLYRSRWRAEALDFLREQGIEVPVTVKDPDSFTRSWDALRRQHFDGYRLITNEFRFLTRIDLVPWVIEDCIRRLPSVSNGLFFELDRQRIREFQRILEMSLEVLQQETFEDKERLCFQSDSRCRELLREMETSPTKFSIEQLHPVVQSLQQKLTMWLEELYQRSIPALNLRLAFDSYSPDNDRHIEVQITIENQIGRSPAESLELMVQANDEFFTLLKPELRLNGSLRGGDQAIILAPLQLTAEALSAEAFSMTVYAQYRTRSDQSAPIVVENFSILLTSEFEEIDNPYKAYAKGGVVHESEMFYGRDEMIAGIVQALVTAPTSKSIVLYGQKRSGKSSILYHIKESLKQNQNMLVLYIENIGTMLDERSPTPLLYQILWNILRQLRRSIRQREEEGASELGLTFPSDLEFYTHVAPLSFFNDFFGDFKDLIGRKSDWKDVRVVLLIDEFSYIYGYIIKGALAEDFMKNWKALLQRNYFSVVLAGQDVMPKFIQKFPNEFGTIEDRQVAYLSDEDARALIDEPIRIGGKHGESRYREKAIERIIELTSANPFYIQIICSRLVEHMRSKQQKLATKADVERIKDNLISDADALRISDFDNLFNSGDTALDMISDNDALEVLRVVALNTRKTSTCSRGDIICETEKPIDDILEDLVNRAVLERERGNYYHIRVGLFKEWLNKNR